MRCLVRALAPHIQNITLHLEDRRRFATNAQSLLVHLVDVGVFY